MSFFLSLFSHHILSHLPPDHSQLFFHDFFTALLFPLVVSIAPRLFIVIRLSLSLTLTHTHSRSLPLSLALSLSLMGIHSFPWLQPSLPTRPTGNELFSLKVLPSPHLLTLSHTFAKFRNREMLKVILHDNGLGIFLLLYFPLIFFWYNCRYNTWVSKLWNFFGYYIVWPGLGGTSCS